MSTSSLQNGTTKSLQRETELTSESDRANAIKGATPPSRPMAMLTELKQNKVVRHDDLQSTLTVPTARSTELRCDKFCKDAELKRNV